MKKKSILFLCMFIVYAAYGQKNVFDKIREFQRARFENGDCLDFVREGDIADLNIEQLEQIIIIRHGEPALDKGGWKNREEAILYTKMYDAVGVYDFDKKPICLRASDLSVVYTSRLPRAINTAEKTLNGSIPMMQLELFNEFERKIIKFPNIRLPRKFWSVTTRLVWIMGGNHKGIETFTEAKSRAGIAASFLDKRAKRNGKTLLFAHGFLNKYIKKYLRQSGYESLSFHGQQYLGAYYFYRIKE